jgi:hypothetical protein
MSEVQALPAVATKVYIFCKKCDADRYHVVIAHTSATSAKTECEICKSKKTYKLETPKASKPKRAVTGAAATRKAASAEAKKSAHKNEFEALVDKAKESGSYNIRAKFTLNHKIEHSKFGTGIVRTVYPDKIEVVFADEVRMLVHNRQ